METEKIVVILLPYLFVVLTWLTAIHINYAPVADTNTRNDLNSNLFSAFSSTTFRLVRYLCFTKKIQLCILVAVTDLRPGQRVFAALRMGT